MSTLNTGLSYMLLGQRIVLLRWLCSLKDHKTFGYGEQDISVWFQTVCTLRRSIEALENDLSQKN